MIFNEFGIAWIPFMMWRMDMEYRAGRDELPWLDRLPSEYITEHVRFTTQPLEEPQSREDLIKLLETFGGDEDADVLLGLSALGRRQSGVRPEGLSDEWRERIFFENARETFKLDARLAPPAPAGGPADPGRCVASGTAPSPAATARGDPQGRAAARHA